MVESQCFGAQSISVELSMFPPSSSAISFSLTVARPPSHPGRASYPSCSLSQRPQGKPPVQLLTWEELLGRR
jgi:hypothetical protein